MKKYLNLLLAVCLLCTITKTVSAQGVDSMMAVYANEYPQQKIYVHFDKSVYRPGETVWFKAYIFAGFEPSDISRNFYAELIDQTGLVVQRKVYQVVQASSAGNFEIPATQNSNLSFRAYTTWMLNFDTSFIYKKEITILNTDGAAPKVAGTDRATQVNFFAEGGDLVSGLEGVVAFKANNSTGKPVTIKGDIRNSKGESIANIVTEHDGMGKVSITPAAGEKYTAFIKDEFGKDMTVPLPDAKPSGVVLKVSSSPGKKVFLIKRSDDAPENMRTLNIVAHMAQQLVYRAKVPLIESTLNSGAIPVAQLPSGILQITVFNDRYEPLAERVVFVNNDNYHFEAKLDAQITGLEKRAKNVYELSVGDTMLTNLSVAITDAQVGVKTGQDNIYSGLLLSGDLKGYIYNPAYYLKNNSDTTMANLDLVMLTHGWRRFNWRNIVQARKPLIKYPADPSTSIIAKVFGVNPSAPIRPDESMTLILQSKDSSTQIVQVPKTGATEFSLRDVIFYDTLKVFYQFSKDRGLASRTSLLFENGLNKGPRIVSLNSWPQDKIDSIALDRAKYFATQISRYGNGNKVNMLQEVIVKTRVRNPMDDLDKKYASGLFAGGDGFSFDIMNDKSAAGFYNIFQYLQGRVPGLQINTSGSNVSLVWRGSNTATFLNEMPADAQTLSSIPVADIAYIKVFRPPFFGATGGGAGGAIAIYTRKGADQPVEPGKGLDKGILTGYSVAKQFYSPNYSDPQQEVTSDLRSTLYWNPFVFTEAGQQKVKLEFYNNDVSTAIRVVIEGVNEIGKLVRIEKVIQ